MNIGAIGWWHFDNQGDLAMLNSLRLSLAPHRLVPLDTDLAYNEDTLTRLNHLDFLLLGGGTLILGRPLPLFQDFHRWGRRLRVPLGVLGLGVSHVEADSSAAIQALIEQSRFFYVRDKTSRMLLDHPAVKLAPDLTFAHPLPLSAGPLSEEEAPLAGVNLRNSDRLNLEAWMGGLKKLPCRWRALPLSSYSSWQEQKWLKILDPKCGTAFSEALYNGLDLVIGTALHAVIFAVQAGVPVIAIDYASKVRRFMAEMGLEEYVLAADGVAELPAVYGRLIERYEEIRKTIGCRRVRLVTDSQAMFAGVRTIIESAGEAKPRRREKVSVIVIAGDSTAALKQTLDSVREQTYPNVETIVVGDNAANTPESGTQRVRTTPGVGLAGRLNAGLAKVSGAYVSWVRAGDCFSADAVAVLVDRLEEKRAGVVYANYYQVINGKIEAQNRANLPYKLKRHNVITPCFLYRRELHDAVGRYDSHSSLPAYDFWLRAAANGRLCPVRTPLLFTRSRRNETEAGLERKIRGDFSNTLPPAQRLIWKVMDNTLADRLLKRARGLAAGKW